MGVTLRRAEGLVPGSGDPGLASRACLRGTPRMREVRLAGVGWGGFSSPYRGEAPEGMSFPWEGPLGYVPPVGGLP